MAKFGRSAKLALSVAAMGLLEIGVNTPAFAAKVADSPISVSMFASPPSDIVNLNTNWFTKYVEKKYNLQIHWVLVPNSDVKTKQSLLLASGNYPDVFYSGNFTPTDILKYASQGIFVPLNSLIKTYAPNLWHAIQTAPGLKQDMVAPDGNIYGIPNYNVCIHCDYSSKFWINVADLKKFGLSMPRDTAEFEHVLEVFKRHGLIPLSGATDGWNSNPVTFLMNSFVYDDGTDYFTINGSKVGFAPISDQWRAGLQYIHNLYAKGLIDHGTFTQTNDILQRKVGSGRVGVVPWGCIECVDPNYNNEVNDWRTVAPLLGPHGVHYAAFSGNTPNTLTFAVTNKASQPAAIALMKLMNFIFTPIGDTIMDYGPPNGKYWEIPKNGQKGMDGRKAIVNVFSDKIYVAGKMINSGWNQMGPMYVSYNLRYGNVAKPPYAPGGVGAEDMLQLETEKNYVGLQPHYVFPGPLWIDPQQAQQYSLYQTNINNFVQQWTDSFIVGSKSLTSDWNTYVQGVKKLSLAQYLQMSQKAMGKPFNTHTSIFEKDVKDIRFLESLK